jgi:hypothetical protein
LDSRMTSILIAAIPPRNSFVPGDDSYTTY